MDDAILRRRLPVLLVVAQSVAVVAGGALLHVQAQALAHTLPRTYTARTHTERQGPVFRELHTGGERETGRGGEKLLHVRRKKRVRRTS